MREYRHTQAKYQMILPFFFLAQYITHKKTNYILLCEFDQKKSSYGVAKEIKQQEVVKIIKYAEGLRRFVPYTFPCDLYKIHHMLDLIEKKGTDKHLHLHKF